MADLFQNLLTTFNFIVQGLWVTISVTAVALTVGVVVGIVMAVARVYGHPALQIVVSAYSVAVRAVPVIVIIFLLFFVISRYVNLSPFWAGALALGFASGAYQTEIFRGALQAVQPGQMIAARAIGMSRLQAIQSVVLPQALRLALPAWSNEAIAMLKYTSVVFLIAVPDLMGQAKILASRYFAPIQIYLIVAVFYIALVGIAYLILTMIERRVRIPGLIGDAG